MLAKTDTPHWIAAILSWRWLLPITRIALTSAYLIGGIQKVVDFSGAVTERAHFGMQPASLWAVAAIIIELAGSLLVIFGRWAWRGAGGLGVLTAVAMFIANNFWTMTGHDRSIPSRLPMISDHRLIKVLVLSFLSVASHAIARDVAPASPSQIGVGAQYDTTHVYVAPEDVDRFVASFLATFGGQSTKQVVATVTPTSSSTTSQLLQTPVGTVSVFGFKTPIPYPFGAERTGYLVTDLDKAITLAKSSGADIVVAAFPDPIGRDAVIQWPGGINMQIYWHTTKPSYAAFETIPENRVYVSPGRADDFTRAFLHFSHGKVVSDESHAPGIEVGRPNDSIRRIRIESVFGKMTVFVTEGHLPNPYGRELTGYEVSNLKDTLAKATASGATILVEPFTSESRTSAIVQFPGGYIAEIHAPAS